MKLKNRFGLDCKLKLALAPTNIEDFSYLINDPEINRILSDSSLYMLVKRPCILFKDLIIDNEVIGGKIIQIGSKEVIEFELPIYQHDVVIGCNSQLMYI